MANQTATKKRPRGPSVNPLPWQQRLMVSPQEAAHILSISREQFYLMLSRKAIASVKCGRSTRIFVNELVKWVDSQKPGTTEGQPSES